MSEVARLVPTKPDAEIASELRKALIDVSTPILEVMDRAKREGFDLQFHIGCDATGRHSFASIALIKKF